MAALINDGKSTDSTFFPNYCCPSYQSYSLIYHCRIHRYLAFMSSEATVKSAGDTIFVLEQKSGASTPRSDQSDTAETSGSAQARRPNADTGAPVPTDAEAEMSTSTHSEPNRQHTKEELMKPGHDHHLTSPPPCPDPSVHRDSKLQEQASTAALYVTRSKSATPKENVLDANNKLSSRSELDLLPPIIRKTN